MRVIRRAVDDDSLRSTEKFSFQICRADNYWIYHDRRANRFLEHVINGESWLRWCRRMLSIELRVPADMAAFLLKKPIQSRKVPDVVLDLFGVVHDRSDIKGAPGQMPADF